MPLKKSTGRGTRVRHSTGLEWDDLKKAKKHYAPIRYSTGEAPSIRHFTGTQFDYKAVRRLAEGGEDGAENPRLHSIPAKAQEDTRYLDLYLRSRVEKARGRDEAVRHRPEGESEGKAKEALGQFKTMALDY